MASSCAGGGLAWILGKCSSLKRWSVIKTGCPGEVTIPGGIQKACGCGTWRPGLVVNRVVLGLWLDWMILDVFPHFNDSISLLEQEQAHVVLFCEFVWIFYS